MHVAILMATYNGAAFLSAQLNSIRAQTHVNWSLFISDDGSTDDTRHIAQDFQAHCSPGQVVVVDGPKLGFAANFLSMIQHVPKGAAMVFCDQDDIWLANRIEAALALCRRPPLPAMILLRRTICTALGKPRSTEPHHMIHNFQAAVFRNPIRGNACFFSPDAVDILRHHPPPPGRFVPFHDWWCCLLLLGFGVPILRSDTVGLLYRHHSGNTFRRHNRIKLVLSGQYKSWVWQNIRALSECNPAFPQSTMRMLTDMNAALEIQGVRRAAALQAAGAPIGKAMLGIGGWI